jgi:2-polyprenyl-3-methyl-5-hydroxy-6-metoxy-1,4-benzoquinol methylase
LGPVGRAANRARCDEAAFLHASSDFYDLDGFRAGREYIRPFEFGELGPVDGLDLIHLQCHLGTDTLSWARHGAGVVGLDFSSNSIAIATRLTEECGLAADFYCADVYDAVSLVREHRFDIVYTGIGALGWLANVTAWAQVVSELLRPNGVLYLVEIHPIVIGVVGDGRTIGQDIFEAHYEMWKERAGTYAAHDAVLVNQESYERVHAISDVLTAVLDAELAIELFYEQSYTNACWPWTKRGSDGFYRLPDGWPKYRLTYSLRARKSQ